MKKKMIFFVQNLNPTGSEVAIYNILCNTNLAINNILVAKTRGSLIKELPKDVQVFIEEEYSIKVVKKNILTRAFKSILHRTGIKKDKPLPDFLTYIHSQFDDVYWYINTLSMPNVLLYAQKNNIPVILHVHELEILLESYNISTINSITHYAELVIASSEAVINMLTVLGRTKQMEVIYPFSKIENLNLQNHTKSFLREKLKIDNEKFIWAMSGYIDNNKNPVFFVDILHNILKYKKQIHFIWFHSSQDNHGIGCYAELYAKYLGLEHNISWVHAEQGDYFKMFAGIDALVLTSHRESFSLITLEALYFKKPVITYKNIGGTTEILVNHTDLLCENYTVYDFVDKMLYVMDNYEYIITYQHHLERFTRDNLLIQWDNLTRGFLSR